MTCYHPVKAYRTVNGVSFSKLRRDDHIGDIELPCGMCIGCRMRRASDWSMRVMHEASLWPENCFVTLTYARDALPPNMSLCHEDFQRFMKRLRKYFRRQVRFYMCGEYGELNQRPHYHACLFNVDFQDRVPMGTSGAGEVFFESALLSKLWTHGRVSVQDLTKETASYTARYIMQKVLGQMAEQHYGLRKPEYNAMSLKPGIGALWYDRYGDSDAHTHDFVVHEGVKRPVPKYYDKLFKRTKDLRLDALEFARQERAKLGAADSTDIRLAAREQVHLAKVSTLKRKNEL